MERHFTHTRKSVDFRTNINMLRALVVLEIPVVELLVVFLISGTWNRTRFF